MSARMLIPMSTRRFPHETGMSAADQYGSVVFYECDSDVKVFDRRAVPTGAVPVRE